MILHLKRKENPDADGQNTSALKKKKMMKKSEEDTPCLYCQENYSISIESWVYCSDCHRWAHYLCAGLEEKYKRPCFTCELGTNCE